MRHYFINTEHVKKDYFKYEDYFLGEKFIMHSCADVFSKNGIDYGTFTLLKTILETNKSVAGNVLDLGCGVGVIGVILSRYYKEIEITFSDINETAVKLAQQNVAENKVSNKTDFIVSNLVKEIKNSFDFVVTNPPIKAGKETLFGVVTGSHEVLKPAGKLVLVIKKQHGMESLKNYMQEVFGNAEVLNRDKGYYVLQSEKQ